MKKAIYLILGGVFAIGAMSSMSRSFGKDSKEKEPQKTEFKLSELEVGQDISGYKIRLIADGMVPFGAESANLTFDSVDMYDRGNERLIYNIKFYDATELKSYKTVEDFRNGTSDLEDYYWGLYEYLDEQLPTTQEALDEFVENLEDLTPFYSINDFVFEEGTVVVDVQGINLNNIVLYKA